MIDVERPAPSLAIALFGNLDVRLNGRPLLGSHPQKTRWLLALLALQEGRAVERVWLAGTLWPDSTQQQAATNLRISLWQLRRALGTEARRLEKPSSGTLRLELAGVEADVLVFDEAISRGDAPSLERAVALYRGPLLQGCVEEWVLPEREWREQAYLAALERLAAEAASRGDPAQAVPYLRRLVAADPLRDSVHRALMQGLAAAGDVAAAAQLYRDFRNRLHMELNAAPDAETTALYQRIRAAARERAVVRDRASEGARERGSEGTVNSSRALSLLPSLSPSRLPRPLTRLVGREEELREIRARLTQGPLVTLTGMGGIGKTRLAIRVAADLAAELPDGAWFVDLAPLPVASERSGGEEVSLVSRTVARVLGVPEQPNEPLTVALAAALRGRRLLLVLDNCEHLLAACARLAEALLGECPHLRILATSRQPLGLTGEIVWHVNPLSLPELGTMVDGRWSMADGVGLNGRPSAIDHQPSALLQSEAVCLFVERAVAVSSGFRLTERNAATVTEICRRLDGIPLAIELAATRLKALSPAELAARLEDRFHLLKQGSRLAQPRQQTLQATLDWSHDLLPEGERTLLRRLSVFAGGWTLEAAEAVCGDDERRTTNDERAGSTGSPLVGRWSLVVGRDEVLDLLTSLVEKSLVVHEEREGVSRYRLLETTREYARGRLAEAGEEGLLRERHREWCIAFAERAGAALHGPEQVAWLNRLEVEHDNLRAALDGCASEDGGAVSARRSALASSRRAENSGVGHRSRATPRGGRQQAAGGQDGSEAGLPAACCLLPASLESGLRLAGALGWFWRVRGYAGEGRERLLGLLARAEQVGVSPERESGGLSARRASRFEAAWARALFAAGAISVEMREAETARMELEACLALARRCGDRELEARALLAVGLALRHAGASARATARLQESLTVAREIGYQRGIAMALNVLGPPEGSGDTTAARRHYEECLALGRALEDWWLISVLTSNLGHLTLAAGDLDVAERYFTESLALTRQLGNWTATFHELVHIGCVALARDRDAEAEACFVEALDWMQLRGDRSATAWSVYYIGGVLLHYHRFATARSYLDEGLARARECGNARACADALAALGRLALREGTVSQARDYHVESLQIGSGLGNWPGTLPTLVRMAGVEVAAGQPERAARLLGATEAFRAARELPLDPDLRPEHDRTVAAVRAALGEVRFIAACEPGRRMSLEQALSFAADPPSAMRAALLRPTGIPPRQSYGNPVDDPGYCPVIYRRDGEEAD